MPGIKVLDIAYARLRAPDLDVMEEFLTEFGMIKMARTNTALYMRGTGPTHHIHVTEKGDPKFIGFAYHAASEHDLRSLAQYPDASGVETMDEPGGGMRVRMTEPNGYQIEVVHGIEAVAPIAAAPKQANNTCAQPLQRVNEVLRLPEGPVQVNRLGHGVLATPRMPETLKWFRERLGLLCSDDVYVGSPENVIASFNRCDRGAEYVDHHVLFCMKKEIAGLNHLAFEVHDIDDVHMGHRHLKRCGKYEHLWGIGRHLAGGQVFDYWADPWGRPHEHWSDSDRLNAFTPGNLVPPEKALRSQWGDDSPEVFRSRICP
jgi:catechol 2,3-dioxygenase-like lactoylglutathione lyase family enzyme